MYLIGGYLRKYPIKESYIFKILSKNLYRLVLVFVFILFHIAKNLQKSKNESEFN